MNKSIPLALLTSHSFYDKDFSVKGIIWKGILYISVITAWSLRYFCLYPLSFKKSTSFQKLCSQSLTYNNNNNKKSFFFPTSPQAHDLLSPHKHMVYETQEIQGEMKTYHTLEDSGMLNKTYVLLLYDCWIHGRQIRFPLI